jgi:uncharacterized protein (TIGR03437 family)
MSGRCFYRRVVMVTMDRQRKILIGKAIAILSVVPVLIYAHQAGPDPGHAGVPGELTCNTSGCHTGTALNGGGGSITINAGGSSYTPGVAQQISVTLTDPKQRRWGFQLTARSASDPTAEAGTFTPSDGLTQVFCSNESQLASDPSVVLSCGASAPLQYIEHTLLGAKITAVGAGNTWTFNWTPPANMGNVILYAAGNAANGDMDITGDHIYTTTLTLSPSSGSGGGGGPTIAAVVNGATFKPGMAENMFVSLEGSGLATTTRGWASGDFKGNLLPTSLDGVSVKINNKPAFVQYVSPTLVNVISPVDTSVGPVALQLTLNGAVSNTMTVQKANFAPSFFLYNSDKYIVALHADYTLIGPTTLYPGASTPAKAGETIILFGNGFGPTTPAIVNGQIVSGAPKLANPVTIQIGGVSGIVPAFAGLTFAGEYQIDVTIPPSTPSGDIPLTATMGGVSSPQPALITVK